ncbi:NAD(P)-binding protein [Didymella exigua CBS 183.55]|uniref:NAD(P)-binding protein n=1 Tax=Didymella exigua CBS 183.55 TaxID=1150837 RepID=A0A6A5RJY9_9PLEO|nr:NAD(P)-binding protein [Didymella exigua CBS 183.55]KAF1927274.1 NAD(P)-binding protein [Didymella exigua CBS 183.55]
MSAPTGSIPLTSVALNFGQTPDLSKLRGGSALITGSARGIGLACATKLAEAGALVTISDIRFKAGEAAVRELTSRGLHVQFVQSDVTSYSSQVELFKKAITFGGGRIDVVVPNAGICAEQNLFDMLPTGASSLEDEPPEPGYSTMDVNLKGVYYTSYLALHYFRLNRHSALAPSLVLIASLAGYVGFPSSATYSMSKFGVRGMFFGTRDRAAAANPPVRVNLVAPWFISTAMTADETFVASEAGAMMKTMGSAQLDGVVQAVMHFSADETAHGRAAGIFPQGVYDLGDDLEGGFAGQRTQQGMLEIVAAMTAATDKQTEELN